MINVKSFIHGLRNILKDRVVILLYHRIANLEPDPQLLCVTPQHFAEQMEIVRNYYTYMSLQDLKSLIQLGKIPHRGLVITFDDGYLDNLQNAFPILEHFHIPATVFATSNYVGKQDEMVSDVLESILLQTETLPPILQLQLDDKTWEWALGDFPAQRRSWNVTLGEYPTPRHSCYHDLHRLLRPMALVERQAVLQQLLDWSGGSCTGRPERRVMNVPELSKISNSGLIEIGSHSANHLMLSQQPIEIQQSEITGSKHKLEQMLGRVISSFAYPYGGKYAVDNKTIDCVREAGFDIACDNVQGTVENNSNILALPRILIRDWDGKEFRDKLQKAFY
jgi:peptidoglycan/xylan/chitin deacetylase (PgdA/CDA1 family)